MPTESATPNFFLLLELNPDDRWDEKEFERVLTQKQREWGLQSQGIGPKATNAKRNIQLIQQIRQVMNDSVEREKQAVAARSERAAGRQKRIEVFETQLKIAQGKGYLEEVEVKGFIADFKDVLTEKEIHRSIKVPIQAQAPEQPKTAQQLEASIAKEIAEKLAQLSLSSLYDLLGRAPTHSREDLAKLAEQLYLDMVRRQPKAVEVTLKQELAGHARKIFASDEMRKKYDESLRQAPVNALLKVLDDTLNRATRKEVYAQQVRDFLEDAQKVGWSREEALTKLEEHVRMRKWFMQEPTVDMTPQQRCGYCSQMNDTSRKFCQKCNRELNITCPRCGKTVPADAVGCGDCGFRVGDRYWVDDSLEKSRLLLADRELQEAQTLLGELETTWNPGKPDKRAEKIREYKDEVRRLLQEQQQMVKQLDQYISQRQFYTARNFLTAQVDTIPNRTTYQRSIDGEIARAQELLKRAQSSMLNREERADLCRQALRVCADYQEARALLSTMPPGPPSNLQARVGGTVVSLIWDLSPTQGVTYTIVRKGRSKPVSVQDGTMLGTVTGRMYDDTQAEIGLPLYYAIFAESEGIVSTQAAVLAHPVLVIQDVSNVIVRVDDGRVDLSWQIPTNTAAVEVVRKEDEAPRSPSDGKVFPLLDLTRLTDQEVENNHLYFYSIYCRFRTSEGKLISSPGVTVQARPETPPEPVRDLEIMVREVERSHDVELRWRPPNKGKTVVLTSRQKLPFKEGQVVQKSQLGQYGQVVSEDRPGQLVLKGVQGIGFCTPVVLLGEAAYVGVCKKYACIEDIRDLTYQNLGASLRLQWKWPPNCREVLVSYSYANWPRPEEQRENTQKVTRTEYEFHGHYDIKGIMLGRNYYIVVAAVIGQGTDQVVASGVRVEARLADKIALTYEIRNPTLFRKKRTLHVFPRNTGVLPALLLLSRRERLPMNKAEGELLLRIEPLLVEQNQEVVIELPNTSFPPRVFGKLYLEDDSAYSLVRIDHPSLEKLRLS